MKVTLELEGTLYECMSAIELHSAWEVFQSFELDGSGSHEAVTGTELAFFANGLLFLLDKLAHCDQAWRGIGLENEEIHRLLPGRLRHIAQLIEDGRAR